MPTRNVILSEHQQQLVESLVQSGRYQNASEVLREGLRLPVVGRILHDAFESPLAVSYGENPRIRPPAWSEAVLAAAGFGAECV